MSNIISFLKAKVSKFFSCLTSPCFTSRRDGSSSLRPAERTAQPECDHLSPIEEGRLRAPSPIEEGKGDLAEKGGSSSLRPAQPPAQPKSKVDPSPIEEGGFRAPSPIEEGKGDLSEKGGSSSLRPAEPPAEPEGKGDLSEKGASLLRAPSPIEEGKGDRSEKGGSLRAPLEGDGSSSSSVSKPSDLITSIKEAAGTAIDGKEGNVNLDQLIEYISELLKVLKENSSTKKLEPQTYKFWSRITSKDLLKLKDFFTEAKEFASAAKDIIASPLVVDLLKGIGHASLATAGLLVIATFLEKFETVSDIKDECLSLLDEMNSLAKHVKALQEEPWLNEQMEGQIRQATELILKASILCCTQIDSSRFARFFSTSENKKDLLTYREELRKMYRVMDNRMSLCLFRANRPRRQKPVHVEYPTNAVGIEGPLNKVIELLDWESEEKAIAVVIHGFGGMGKTTLADAVYATLFDQNNIKGCKYAMVRLFETIASIPNVMRLQMDIIKDLRTGTSGTSKDEDALPNIRRFEEGRSEIGLLLKEEVAFIYIDNVLLPDNVEQGLDAFVQLLPQDMGTAKKVRLLITARDKNAVRMHEKKGIRTEFYSIESLVDEKAMKLFKQELGDKEEQLDSSQMNDIVEACGGIPKLLAVVAGFIKEEENAKLAYRTVMEESKNNWKGVTGEKIECYVFAYKNLENSLRDPFLDICSFFQGWDWETLSNIVGEEKLKKLEKRELVTQDVKSMTARVHDIILKIGLQKSEGERFRFTSSSEIQEFFDQKEDEDLRKIKGIWSSENKDPLYIPASKLDLMCKSLRVLTLGRLTDVDVKFKEIFERLVYFSAQISHLPFELSKLKGFKELRYLCFQPADLQNLSQMPSNLRHIDLQLNSPDFQISSNCIQQVSNLRVLTLRNAQLKRLPSELGNVVNGLRKLVLSECQYLEELPESISKLGSLRVLSLFNCSGLRQLPTDLGSLNYLQKLDLRCCTRLEALPSSLENLTSLQNLNLSRCESLKALPSNLGKLISLQELDLGFCESLEALPTSVEELSSLRNLSLSRCTSLEDLPYGIGKLTSLVNLRLHGCTKLSSIPDSIGQLKVDSIHLSEVDLKQLPDGFCNLSCITKLTMNRCHRLEELPDRFGEATSLIHLTLAYCENLKKLPKSFSQLKCLEELDLSECTSLEELCTDFKCLSSLRVLSLKECRVLKKLPESFGQLKCLEKLDLSGCTSLEELCADFKCLSSLRVLSLEKCEVLKKLPEDFDFLTSLQTLHLTDCYMLEGKWMESMVKMKTLQVLRIKGSTPLEERWGEIQRQGDQSWPCAVHTRQGFSNKENALKQLQSEFDCLLINGRGEPVHISDLPPNILLLVLFDGQDSFYRGFPFSLIEESIDDIQANLVMVYFGKHFNEFPKKVANKIVGHAPADAKARALFQKLLVAAEEGNSSDWPLTDRVEMSAKVVSDEKGYKYLSSWELLSDKSAEEFVVKKCGKYLKLKQLVESPRENHTELLRELFASGEEKSSLDFLKSGALTQVGVKELKGKKILLDIRQARICYDIPLLSLVEMYLAEKDRFNFEIITIPITDKHTQLDVCKKFSGDVPWLVIQDPWQLTAATKHFLYEGTTVLYENWYTWYSNTWHQNPWHPNIMRIIESNGTMAAHNLGGGGLLRMVNAWGAEAYPFTEERYEELMEKGVREMKSMPHLLFLFQHLESVSEQVKRAMREQKMICLYTSDKREFTNSINNVLMEWSDSIYIIHIPKIELEKEPLHFPCKLSEMQGMSLLNLSEHEVMRFWARISSVKEAWAEIDDEDEELNKIYYLMDFIYPRKRWESYLWMVIMDEDGNLITEQGKEIVELLCEEHQNGKAKELMKQLMKGTKESRKEILVELEQLSDDDDADDDADNAADDDDADDDAAADEDDADDDDADDEDAAADDAADEDDADDAAAAADNDNDLPKENTAPCK